MAILIRGELYSSWEQARAKAQLFRAEARPIRNRISGSASGRYQLYAGYGDPWSHRTIMLRELKGLRDAINLVLVDPVLTDSGWRMLASGEHLYKLYLQHEPTYTGRITVPILWDRESNTIVSNESADIMRMLNDDFPRRGSQDRDFRPPSLHTELARLNGFIFDNVNNGVYKVGFATNQALYDKCISALFGALDELEEHLATSRFLLGEELTEADVRLFATLVRFDTIYYPCLKCNRRRLVDYRHLWPYTRDIFQYPGIKETVKFDWIKKTYYGMKSLNPTAVIPEGPLVDFDEPVHVAQYQLYAAPI